MKRIGLLLCSLLLVCAPTFAAGQKVTVNKGSLLCYERGDWESMLGAIADSNIQLMGALINSGKCQTTAKAIQVTYLDPIRGSAALIQMPSGRGAFVFEVDITR